VLHPVAVVIFSGLISSTLLDTFLTQEVNADVLAAGLRRRAGRRGTTRLAKGARAVAVINGVGGKTVTVRFSLQ
jgi:hypothetical protein